MTSNHFNQETGVPMPVEDRDWVNTVTLFSPQELVREACWVQALINDCLDGMASSRALVRLQRRQAALNSLRAQMAASFHLPRTFVPNPQLTPAR